MVFSERLGPMGPERLIKMATTDVIGGYGHKAVAVVARRSIVLLSRRLSVSLL